MHVGKQGVAQIGDKTFADGGAKVALHRANERIGQRNTNHPQRQQIEPGNVAVGDGVVNQIAKQQRCDQA